MFTPSDSFAVKQERGIDDGLYPRLDAPISEATFTHSHTITPPLALPAARYWLFAPAS